MVNPHLTEIKQKKIRYVQSGRLALVSYGPWEGHLAVIKEVIDHRRVVIGNPVTKMPWHQTTVRRLKLTAEVDSTLKPISQKTKWVKKTESLLASFKESKWAKVLALQEKKKNMNDFQRFKLKWAKTRQNQEAKKAIGYDDTPV